MKKEELLIGDLVRVKTDKDYILYPDTVCIIQGIESWQCDKLSDDVRGVQLMTLDRIYRTLDLDDIEGIPLTTEFLVKNGWEKSSNREGESQYRKLSLCITHLEKINGFYFHGLDLGEGNLRHITYVHQLQHILWVLAMNDKHYKNELERINHVMGLVDKDDKALMS